MIETIATTILGVSFLLMMGGITIGVWTISSQLEVLVEAKKKENADETR